MKRLCLQLLVTSCCFLLAVAGAFGSSLPRYGGTARILLQHKVASLDPLADEDYPEERDRLAALTFETLTQIDAQGHLRPLLAGSWESDSAHRFWQFRLRLAKFHDGTALTATDVIASLTKAEPSWRYTTVDRQTVTIETPASVNHLPEMLAVQKFAIVKRQTDGTLAGTGPYQLREWQSGERALFAAFDDYWGGRSYPDAIEVQMGASLRDQLLQRQLGPASAAELNLDALRVLDPNVQNVLLSRPSDLLVILFLQPDNAPPGRGARKPIDPRMREALAASVSRPAVSALLQHRATAASGLLPQWLTGYEFLMGGAQDPERARRLAASAGGLTVAITLAYDFSDPTAKLVAERIQVDAGQAGIQVRTYGESHLNSRTAQASMNADAILLRLPLPSAEPQTALAILGATLNVDSQTISMIVSSIQPEDLVAAERKALEGFHIIPVARLPQAVWVNGSAHNWQQLPTGAWDLSQLWVEGAR